MAPPAVAQAPIQAIEAQPVDRFADDDHAALIAAEMLLA
jgi:hypothetical protein